jgi:hypothetical protein
MIVRPLTLISGLMFAVSGAYLFMVKHQSETLDDQISAVTQATRQDEQSIRVLQAQWALEADPSRLAALAAQFTGLQPMKPGQLTTLASLGNTLPAPGSAPPGANPVAPATAMPQLAQAAPSPAAPPPSQAAKPAAPVQLAAASLAPAKPAAPTRPAPSKHAPTPQETLASAAPVAHHATRRPARNMPQESGSALYVATATPAPAPVPAARSQPVGARIVPVQAVASVAPAPMPIDNGGSMLGMAQGGSN